MKRLLEINSVCGISSTGKIAINIAKEFEQKGYEVAIGYGRGLLPDKYKLYGKRIGTKFGVLISAFLARIFDNDGLGKYFATKRFIKWADTFNPDILWIHNIHGYYINYKLLFKWIKKRENIKVNWTLHDCWSFTGHCSHFDFVGCDKWKTQCFNCPQKSEYPRSVIFDCSKKNYKIKKESFVGVKNMTIIVPSNWLAGLVRESFLNCYQVEVIHNKIDLNVFKYTDSDFRERYNIKDKILILGVSSIWLESKGYFEFIKLADMIDDHFVIVMIGLKNKQMEEVPKNVIGIEKTNNQVELAEIYSAADVFVNPTFQDTYPTVNLEAQACGTPCITYRAGGSSESVPPENVVEKGDVVALFNRIKELTKYPSKKYRSE